MKLSKELKTGIIAVIAISVMIWGYNYLKKQNLFDSTRVYYSEFDNVQGLTPSSIVTINGFQVGNVSTIKFNPKKKGSFVVSYTLTSDFPFSKNSETRIIPPTISGMGAAELTIIPSYDGEEAKSGSYLNGNIQQGLIASLGNKVNPLNNKLSLVLTNVDKLLVNLNNTLDVNTQNNIKSSIHKLNASLGNFRNASKSLDDLLAENKTKFSAILDNATSASEKLNSVSTSFEKANLSNDLKQTVTKLNATLNSFDSVLSEIDKGNGTIGKLLKDKGLYTNLENASKEMEELLREMKEHPKRFVHFSLFGKKDKTGYIKDTVN